MAVDIFTPVTPEEWRARAAFYRKSAQTHRDLGNLKIAEYWEKTANDILLWLVGRQCA
jgi:hypothetical protein